jgi:hypothetical protein
MANKGSKMKVGDTLVAGDWLQSDDGNSVLALEATGLYLRWADAWKSFGEGSYNPWTPGFAAPPEGYFLSLTSDGNLTCCAGSPSNPGRLLWQSGVTGPPAPGYAGVMQDDGNFCVNKDGGAGPALWCAGCARISRGLVSIQGAYDNKLTLYITSDDDSNVCMQTFAHPYEKIDLIVNNQPIGFLLKHPKTTFYLRSFPKEGEWVRETSAIIDDSILIQVNPGSSPAPGDWMGLRPRSGGDLHFNIPGPGPYTAGQPIIMYRWARPATTNEIWCIRGVKQPKAKRGAREKAALDPAE